MKTVSKRWIGGLAATAALALTLGTGVMAAEAATPAPKPSASASQCSFGQHLLAAYKGVPDALKTDLKALKDTPKGDARKAKAEEIRTKALAGGYGPGVQARAEWRKDHPGEKLRPIPDALKADLKALKGEPKAQKLADVKKIADKAVAGGYGDAAQSIAKAIEASPAWQDCVPAK